MDRTHTFRRTGLNRGIAACLTMMLSLSFAAFIPACSDAPVDYAADDALHDSSEVPRTPAVHHEVAATDTPLVQEKQAAKSSSALDEVADSEADKVSDADAKLPHDRESGVEDEEPVLVMTFTSSPPETGPTGLDERILRADLIVRATLTSVSTSTPHLTDAGGDMSVNPKDYLSVVEMRFDAHEYLKGDGDDTLVVKLPLGTMKFYPSAGEAMEAVRDWLPKRDTTWDGREAIIFLQNPPGSQAESEQSGSSVYVFAVHTFGDGLFHDRGTAYAVHDKYIDTYSIRSKKNKVWLPATSAPASGASGASETSYYLEEPPSSGTGAPGASGQSSDVPSISLSDLKSRVRTMDELVEEGEGVTGYRRCLQEKYKNIRTIQYMGSEGIRGGESVFASSGLPAGSIFNEGRMFGGGPGSKYDRYFFAGPDAHLFEIGVEDNDTDARSYSVVATTTRPLPRGTYEIHYNAQSWLFFPCNHISDSYLRWYVHVNPPAGTLHEAFFDPALDTSTSSVGADAANGVLKPSAFSDSGSAATTISSLEWKSGTVKMNISPHTALDGQVLDFIELDGSVSLSLDAADATADSANNALSWTVASQPWEDGDKLMLRIRKGPNRPPVFDTSTYAFTVREDASTFHVIGSISASDPDAGDSVLYYITDGNAAGRFQIGSNHGEILVWGALDYESVSSYTLSIEARDGEENGTATATVQISVTDVAE